MDLATLKDQSIRLYPGLTVCWPQYGDKIEALPAFHVQDANDLAYGYSTVHRYWAMNNGVVCFMDDANPSRETEAYVTPCVPGVLRCLQEAGYQERRFYVPFSNWDYPVAERGRWEILRAQAAAA